MNAFKRKALSTVVLGALGAAGTAHAVYQDPSGQGQALIYPYFTVQAAGGNNFNTYLSIVNSTSQGKVLKVRAREGKTSAEILDFNLYLSPNDVWTAAIIPSDTSATSPARIITADRSCTNPPIPAAGEPFRNFQYVGDGLGNGLDRTREGYLEIIEMSTITGSALAAATHNAAGVPTCAGLVGATVGTTGNVTPANRSVPTGGLSGTGTLINVNTGVDAGYNAVALANLTATDIYSEIGTEQTNFNQANGVAVVVSNNEVYRASFTTGLVSAGVQAVSATMQHASVVNEFVLDASTRSNTDWVLTFPTKWYFYEANAGGTPVTPFTAVLGAPNGACETIAFAVFNREEGTTTPSGVDFSPLPPGAPASSLCWESTVMSFRNGASHVPSSTTSTSGVLGSVNTSNVNIPNTFQNGWARVTFTGTNATTTGITSDATSVTTNALTGATVTGAQTFRGLPVTGFMVRTFANGTVPSGSTTVLSNYATSVDHKYTNSITPTP